MSKLKFIAVIALLPIVAACTSRLDRVSEMTPSGTEFQKALHQGYVGLARSEYAEYDNRDACRFTDRAKTLSEGGDVLPEEIANRDLPSNKVSVLTSARKRLMMALDGGARRAMPAKAAEAQVAFDCWMQEQEENKQPDDIAACQGQFIAAMEALEPKPVVEAPAPAPAPEPMAAAAPAAPVFPIGMSVFFDFDKDTLDAVAKDTINDAHMVLKEGKASSVVLQAYADRSGDSVYNMALAERRAEAVQAALMKAGVPADAMKIIVYGENNLIVPTQDGVREAKNRRVEFLFSK